VNFQLLLAPQSRQHARLNSVARWCNFLGHAINAFQLVRIAL
jgi:hypothetical protein